MAHLEIPKRAGKTFFSCWCGIDLMIYDIYVRLQRGLSGLNSGLNHINKAANTNRKTDIKMQWSPIVVAVRILAFSTFVDY